MLKKFLWPYICLMECLKIVDVYVGPLLSQFKNDISQLTWIFHQNFQVYGHKVAHSII